jgi:MFS family permease
LLTATIIQPLFNALSQMFGRKAITMASITLLAIGSVLGGIAPNARLLLAGRSVQGLGSGGCLAMTYAFMTDLVSLKNRGKWFGIISISWGVGTILGPMIGGAFAEDKWQWIFWINLPFCGIAIITSFITLGLPSRFTPAFMGLGYFDWAGTIILGGSLTAILIAISWGRFAIECIVETTRLTILQVVLCLDGELPKLSSLFLSVRLDSPLSLFTSSSVLHTQQHFHSFVRVYSFRRPRSALIC